MLCTFLFASLPASCRQTCTHVLSCSHIVGFCFAGHISLDAHGFVPRFFSAADSAPFLCQTQSRCYPIELRQSLVLLDSWTFGHGTHGACYARKNFVTHRCLASRHSSTTKHLRCANYDNTWAHCIAAGHCASHNQTSQQKCNIRY